MDIPRANESERNRTDEDRSPPIKTSLDGVGPRSPRGGSRPRRGGATWIFRGRTNPSATERTKIDRRRSRPHWMVWAHGLRGAGRGPAAEARRGYSEGNISARFGSRSERRLELVQLGARGLVRRRRRARLERREPPGRSGGRSRRAGRDETGRRDESVLLLAATPRGATRRFRRAQWRRRRGPESRRRRGPESRRRRGKHEPDEAPTPPESLQKQ